jgi:hypothetical protein
MGVLIIHTKKQKNRKTFEKVRYVKYIGFF